MKIIRYTLLENGEVPSDVVDGGYFIKFNGGQSPQDYDMIGLSVDWTGLEEYETKLDFENYINSFLSDYIDNLTETTVLIQDVIDAFWLRSLE